MPRRRAVRTNARRTWPDGSGCEQRPLHPCSPGCPGWGWFNDEEIQRCDDCKIFDDDEDAREHVAGCATCRDDLAKMQQPKRGHGPVDRSHRRLPRSRARQVLCDYFYDELYGTRGWTLDNLPDPSDRVASIEQFLFRVGAGDYDFLGEDGRGYESPKAAAWWTLRDWAGDDFTDYMTGVHPTATEDWDED